jgi:hypothetical protein
MLSLGPAACLLNSKRCARRSARSSASSSPSYSSICTRTAPTHVGAGGLAPRRHRPHSAPPTLARAGWRRGGTAHPAQCSRRQISDWLQHRRLTSASNRSAPPCHSSEAIYTAALQAAQRDNLAPAHATTGFCNRRSQKAPAGPCCHECSAWRPCGGPLVVGNQIPRHNTQFRTG